MNACNDRRVNERTRESKRYLIFGYIIKSEKEKAKREKREKVKHHELGNENQRLDSIASPHQTMTGDGDRALTDRRGSRLRTQVLVGERGTGARDLIIRTDDRRFD